MSCGAECLMEMLDFSGRDRFRGSPGCCGGSLSKYGGSNTNANYDSLSRPNDKYASSLSNKGYSASMESNYFESQTRLKNYFSGLVYKPSYKIAVPNNNVQASAEENKPSISNEIDILEAMINAARQKEALAWTQ